MNESYFKRNRLYHGRRLRRRGAILIGVLACLIIGTAMAALTLQSALRGRREARLERQLRQTCLLCQGGVSRAVQKLTTDVSYRGEHWQPDLGSSLFRDAHVEIAVSALTEKGDSITGASADNRAAQSVDRWEVRVIASLDSTSDIDGPMQRSHTFTYRAPDTSATKQSTAESTTESTTEPTTSPKPSKTEN